MLSVPPSTYISARVARKAVGTPTITQNATRPGRKKYSTATTSSKPERPLFTSSSMRSLMSCHCASKTSRRMLGGSVGPVFSSQPSSTRAAFSEWPLSLRCSCSSTTASPRSNSASSLLRGSRVRRAISPRRTTPSASLTTGSGAKASALRRCSRPRISRAPSASPAMPAGKSRASWPTRSPTCTSDSPSVSSAAAGISIAMRSSGRPVRVMRSMPAASSSLSKRRTQGRSSSTLPPRTSRRAIGS